MGSAKGEALGLSLDHVALVTGNLAESRDCYEKLGFTLTRVSSHKGRVTPDGPVVQWGSGNHCAMFQRGYIEILGLTDPNRYYEPFRQALSGFHGVSMIALGTDDVAALYQRSSTLRRRPIEVHRDVPLGVSGDATREATFRIMRLDDDAFPEADLFFIEHATPQVLWQSQLLDHPNRVIALVGITLCTETPDETAARFERCTGLGGAAVEGSPFFWLDGGFVKLWTPQQIAKRYPGAVLPSVPSVGVVELQVSDLRKAKVVLEASGVTPHSLDDGVWIRPERTGGVILELKS